MRQLPTEQEVLLKHGPIVCNKKSDHDAVKAFRKRYGLFKNFLYRVWKTQRLPNPTRVQYDIADYLQFGPARSIIMALRGEGKSWITVAYCAWKLGMNPQERILVVSASQGHADDFSTFLKSLIANIPELRFLQPRPGQRDSNVGFDVGPALPDKAPSVKSVGITGQITGTRATLIIPDDIETPSNTGTVLQRQKLANLVNEFDAIVKPDERAGNDPSGDVVRAFEIRYLGTPHTEESLYLTQIKKGYDARIWPIAVPEKPAKYVLEGVQRLAPIVFDSGPVGSPVDPERFGPEEVIKQRAKGLTYFALQYMIDTSLSDQERYPLKLKDLIVLGLDLERAPSGCGWAEDPRYAINDLESRGFTGDNYYSPAWMEEQFLPYQGSVLAVDPAGRGKDEIGLAVIKHLHGKLYLTASVGLRGGPNEDNLVEIAKLAKTHRVNSIFIEENFGDGMFGALLRPVLAKVYPVTIEGTRATGQKELRIINTLEGVIQTHRLVVDRRVIEEDLALQEQEYSLFFQMTRLTKERGALIHDDRLDALEMAVRYFLSQMETDEKKAAAASAQEALDRELEEFMRELGTGTGRTNPSWSQGA